MRRVMAVILAAAVSGCVRPAPQLPAPQGPWGAGSTNWRALTALPHGQFIFVTVDGGYTREASRWSVSDTAVTLLYDWGSYAIPRASVTQVVERVQIGTKEDAPWDEVAVGVATVIGGALAYARWGGKSKNKNKNVEDLTGGAVVVGTLVLATAETKVKPVYADRLVYIRP
jgi:hypothetical protein